jgi:hypothetical protein
MSDWHNVVTPDPLTHVAKHLVSQCSPAWCGREPSGDEAAIDVFIPAMYRYENTLKWISTVAFAHYLGGAFDPGHMRAIANMAADALAGKDLDDHDTVMEDARAKASGMAERLSRLFQGDDEEGQ